MFAVRNSYIIDNIKFSFFKADSFVLFGPKNPSFASRVAHELSLNSHKKPYKLEIISVDSNTFVKPDHSIFFKVVLLAEILIVIYHQPKSANCN